MRAGTCSAIALLACLVGLQAVAQVPPAVVKDQLPLLRSADPKLAANKRLVFDMMRTVLNAGLAGEAAHFVTPEYIQHNPNVTSGRQGLVDYIRRTRPERPVPEQITFPVISITAEGDLVTVATVDYENETTHFDMFRVENGLIAEHWDNVSRGRAAATKDPNVSNKPK